MPENQINSLNSKSQNKGLNIEYIDIALLRNYKHNAKIHSDKQVAKIAQSMHTFGVVTPILVDKNYEIIAGHGRIEALKGLGYQVAPVIMLEHLTEAQVKAYRLADNRLAEEAEYDKDILKIELQELSLSTEFTITDTGFDIAEIDEIIIDNYGVEKETQDEADGVDNINEITERVKLGDIWGLDKLVSGSSPRAHIG